MKPLLLIAAIGAAGALAQSSSPEVLFRDITREAGITFQHHAAPEKRYIVESMSGGVALFDYDNDGLPDIYFVDSLTVDTANDPKAARSALYKNLGNGKFQDVSSAAGPGISARFSSRGAAFGDYDNDGDIDALILNLNDPPSLLRNNGGNKQNWIKIKLIGTQCNRTAIGARVRVVTGKHTQMNEVHSGSSVMSQSDLRLHFGVGKATVVDLIEVKWPTTQKVEKFTQVKANQILTIREGSGIVKSPSK